MIATSVSVHVPCILHEIGPPPGLARPQKGPLPIANPALRNRGGQHARTRDQLTALLAESGSEDVPTGIRLCVT